MLKGKEGKFFSYFYKVIKKGDSPVLKGKILIIPFLLVTVSVFSQKKPVITLDENDGLCENSVREIVLDREHVLWVGTDNGLSRYDGDMFHSYHKSEGLAGNMIWGLAVDSANRIYAGCYTSGLSLLEDGVVVHTWRFRDDRQNTIRKLLWDDGSGCLVVGTDYGIYLFRDSVLFPIQFPYPSSPRMKSSILSLKPYKGRIFFTVHGYSGDVYELKIDAGSLGRSRVIPLGNDKSMFALTFYHDTILINHYNELYAVPLREGTPVLYGEAPSDFLAWDMVTLPADWIIAGGFRISSFGENARLFDARHRAFYEAPWWLQSSSVMSFCYDTLRKIVWAATDNGLKALMNTPFSYYDIDIGEILDLVYHKGTLYLLTDDGIYTLEKEKAKMVLTRERINRELRKRRKEYLLKNSHQADESKRKSAISYTHFIQDNGRVFLNTTLGSVSVPELSDYLPFAQGYFITRGNSGYYVKSYNYLCYYHDLKNIFRQVDTLGRAFGGGIRDVFDIRRSGEVYFFMSYFNGLYAVSGEKSWNLNEGNSGIDNFLISMDLDREGNVWVVSPNGNLFEIGFEDSLFIKRKINRFNSEIIGENYKWLKFSGGNLYLATNKGLNIIPETEILERQIDTLWFYNRYNGYLDISTTGPVLADRGYMFVRTKKGLLRIGAPVRRKKHAEIRVREVVVDGRHMRIACLDGVSLPSQTKDIRMIFYLLDYPTDQNVEYRYRVNGGKWVCTDVINLPFLKPGEYDIIMEARDLEMNKVYRQRVNFFVLKPFWLQWWFVGVMLLLFLGMIYFFIRLRYESLRKKEEIRTRMIRESAELQIKALQLQMSPHFIFNALNTIQAAVMTKNKDETLDFIGDLSLVIRENLENVSKDYIPLSREIAFLQRYAGVEKFRLGEKINIEFVISVDDAERLLIPPMLIQPLLENSIKHGLLSGRAGGDIVVKIDQEMDHLLVSVQDNGIGRKKAAELSKNSSHQSKGILLLKNRLHYLNQKNDTSVYRLEYEDLYEDGEPAGTVARLYLQIIRRKKEEYRGGKS